MAAIKVLKYVIYDVLRSRMVMAYAVLLFIFSYGLLYLESDVSKSILSQLNILLLLVPLISIIFGTIHFYNSREFIEILLAQPISRLSIFLSEYFGLAISLTIALLIGAGIPTLIFGFSTDSFLMLAISTLLTFVFVAFAALSAIITHDKARGIGISLLLWFYFSIIYDAFVLFILFYFSDYPMENAILILSALNPIDLARILMIIQLDAAALMGYTGAVFQDFLGSFRGSFAAIFLLCLWVVVPLLSGAWLFNKKDL